MASIYKIINKTNGKFYIGSTTNSLYKRMHEHLSHLKANRHHNKHLQSAWNKYGGRKNFEFVEIETFLFPENYSKEYINEYIGCRELYWITQLSPEYNMCREYNRGVLGRILSEEAKRMISEKNKGRKRTDKSWVGRKHSEESKEKMRVAKLGTKRGPYKKKEVTIG